MSLLAEDPFSCKSQFLLDVETGGHQAFTSASSSQAIALQSRKLLRNLVQLHIPEKGVRDCTVCAFESFGQLSAVKVVSKVALFYKSGSAIDALAALWRGRGRSDVEISCRDTEVYRPRKDHIFRRAT